MKTNIEDIIELKYRIRAALRDKLIGALMPKTEYEREALCLKIREEARPMGLVPYIGVQLQPVQECFSETLAVRVWLDFHGTYIELL